MALINGFINLTKEAKGVCADVIKCFDSEVISRTFNDHNLGGQFKNGDDILLGFQTTAAEVRALVSNKAKNRTF